MASSSFSASSNNNERRTTPILQEFQRLQAVQSFLTDQWQAEVHLYENSSSGAIIGAVGDGNDVIQATRNHPNSSGTVENKTLFPYHTALYPLLDCYDSIRDGQSSGGGLVVRPSPAPMPFLFNSHRRSKFSSRLDRHGAHIEELASLEGHLPNSAWAIQQLMPHDRKVRFVEYKISQLSNRIDESDDDSRAVQAQRDLNENNNGGEPPSHHNNTRFWNILMNPVSASPVVMSDMSVPPVEEVDEFHSEPDDDSDEWDDAGDEDDGDWEDIDDEDEKNLGSGTTTGDTVNTVDAARDFTFLKYWQHAIVEERRGTVNYSVASKMKSFDVSGEGASLHKASSYDFSPEILYTSSPSPVFTLLKVLKHSLSDLQREFRLARAVALLIADWQLCDDDQDEEPQKGGKGSMDEVGGIECLRRILTIVSSEYVGCGGYCHEWYISQGGISDNEDEFEDIPENSAGLDAPNHYCSDWWEFLGSLCTVLSYGITYMTQQHANVICAFVAQEINRASSSAGPTEGVCESSGEVSSGKAYLKQNIYFLNNAEYDAFGRHTEGGFPQDGVGCQLNINLLLTIVSALRQHAVSDRMRLVKLLHEWNGSHATRDHERGDDEVAVQITKSVNSFQACADILVDIGERCLLRLPTNNHGRQLGGMIVRGLVESYVDRSKLTSCSEKPLSYLAQETNDSLRSVIDPRRYADAVSNSSNNPLLDPSRSPSHSLTGEKSIEQLVGFQPPKDVQDVVKGLFMRDLVDLQVSGCGYGDFLSWCHLPISPEPLLFDYVSNFPSLGSAGDGELGSGHWVVDEDGMELDQAHLSARYDFSLLVFLRQWHSPWTPESHLSFSLSYRRAVSTLALCAHRYGVPHDISILVNSFLPRSWWSDDRRCCWCRECQLNQLKREFQAKIATRQRSWSHGQQKTSSSRLEAEKREKVTLISCPGCCVAMACSRDHMKYLHQDGHKRYCGLPPFRAPFNDEDNGLCRVVFGEKETSSLENGAYETAVLQDEGFDDDGSWESVDSSEEGESVQWKSNVIFSFFNDKSYKLQRREAPPFANFF